MKHCDPPTKTIQEKAHFHHHMRESRQKGEQTVIDEHLHVEKIRAAFDRISQRHTRPRRLIEERLVQLACSESDFTIDDLWQSIRESESRLGRATVYRAVEALVDMGLLDKVEFADGSHHYRVCGGSHHHHLTCVKCRRVVEVDVCLPAETFTAVKNQTDFEIEGHSLALFGRCPECRV